MQFRKTVAGTAKSIFNFVGLDVVRKENSPSFSLVGLKNFAFTTIIDVGANTGQFAKKISKFFPEARLFCFEPLPGPHNLLTSWANTENGRVKTFNLAIGQESGQVEMNLHNDHTPSSSILATTALAAEYYPLVQDQTCIRVEQATLDDAMKQAVDVLSPEILIKLDVQGYEDRVISGGSEVFLGASACIVEICLDHLYEGQASFSKLVTMLESLGLTYAGNLEQSYGEDGHCIFLDAVFVRRD